VKVFGKYAEYFDLIYADKDYQGEAAFVLDKLDAKGSEQKTLLELGCGTGRHAIEFAKAGFGVTGIDLSVEMVTQAQSNCRGMGPNPASPIFLVGDIRNTTLGTTFQHVVSLFHVLSYQTSNADLLAAFRTAALHLTVGGRFFFDFWYGPAVLSDPPTVRVRRFQGSRFFMTRIAEPYMRPNDNCVDVRIEVLLQTDSGREMVKVSETHSMRYLFLPEIVDYLARVGLRMITSGGWNSQSPLGPDTWYGWALAEHE
jgi:SAM-dependent methyltransferase